MSSKPPGHDRFSQMSEQAAIIARKKAEIEAKIKATSEEKGISTSKSSYGSFSTPTNKPTGKTSRNRWCSDEIQWLAKKLVIWSIYLINLVFLTKVFEL